MQNTETKNTDDLSDMLDTLDNLAETAHVSELAKIDSLITVASAAIVPETPETETPETVELSPAEIKAVARATVSAAYRSAESGRVSVPIKSATGFRAVAIDATTYAGANQTARSAYACAVALAAQSKTPKNGVTFDRRFDLGGVASIIENGAGKHIVGSGIATFSGGAGNERFKLTKTGSAHILGVCGAIFAS